MNPKISVSTCAKNQSHDGTHPRNANGADHPPRNSVIPRPLTANISRYSARKNSANLNPEYSMKYPEIISDSLSGKSNGLRFVSAVAAIINRMNPASPHGVNTFQCASPFVVRACRSTMLTSDSVPD